MRTEEWQEKAAFIDKLRELTEPPEPLPRGRMKPHAPLVNDEVYATFWLSDLQTLESLAGVENEKLPHKEKTII